MKKLLFPIFSILIIGGIISCNKDYLNVKPTSSITAGNFYQSQQDIQQAVTGVYSSLQDWPVDIYLFLSEVRSNNFYAVFADAQRDYFDINNYQVNAQDGTVHDTWQSLYSMINRANGVLANIDNVSFDNLSLKTQYKSEVRFLRAFAYFQLVRLWGRVPLVEKVISPSEGIKIKQSDPADIYNFITTEMEAVKDSLPGNYTTASDVGRATSWAVKGVLAKVYLTMAGYPLNQAGAMDKAKALLEEIIAHEGATPKLNLTPNYADLFGYKNDNLHNIFEVQYVSGGLGEGSTFPSQVLGNVNTSLVNVTILNSASRLTISQDLLTSYDSIDQRFNVTIDTSYMTNDNPPQHSNVPFFKKFVDFGLTTLTSYNDWPENFPLLRYADVLLMEAEILNDQSGPGQPAIDLLNRVRTRAGLPSITPTTKEEFDTALTKEYRLEFADEGQYWFYLVRTGKAISTMNAWFTATGRTKTIDEHNLVYPIPQTEIDVYPDLYQQNPGY
ncbi:MAG TPA: RagB/SusD family nutrient uptake outer membrane protein [Hanamia sp.]